MLAWPADGNRMSFGVGDRSLAERFSEVRPPMVAQGGHSRYRCPAQVHVLLRNPQVELVPCRRRQHGVGVADTSEMVEGGTST